MAERIVIAELELNTQALQEANTKLIQDISKLREEQKLLKKETGNLSTATDEQAKKFLENDVILKKLTGEYNFNKNILSENVSGVKNLSDALGKSIKSENDAIKNNKELVIARKQLNVETEEGKKAISEINAKIDDNNKFLKNNASELEKQKIGIGGYKEAFTGAFEEIKNGNITGGFATLKNGIISTTRAMLAFIATPIGAAIAGITGIALATKEVFDYNNSIKENIKLIENLTGKTGEVADEIRNKISGISETFGLEFKGIANAVDNLIDTGVAKNELEALEQIKKGLAKAPDKNEFISSLESSALTAKQVGLELNEVISAKESIESRGIDGEAVFGSLQKATQKLAEGGAGLKESLTNAFGSAFSDEILSKVKSGELTTSQALEKINQKSKELSLNQTQQANLQIDLFGKQSLAAGGFEQIIGVINDVTKKNQQPLSETQKKTLELANANEQLATAKDKALKSDSVLSFQKNLEIFWIKAQTIWYGFIDVITEAYKWGYKVTGFSELLGETWDGIKKYATALWQQIDLVVDIFKDLFNALGLNNESSSEWIKTIFKTLNPLNLLKQILAITTSSIVSFTNFLQNSKTSIVAFAIATKDVLTQISNAVKNFDLTNPLKSLKELSSIDISSIYKKANEEAKKQIELNKMLRASESEKQKKEDVPKNPTTTSEPQQKTSNTSQNKDNSIDEYIKQSKLRLQIFIEESKGKAKTLEDELKFEEQLMQKKIEILKYELKSKKVSEDEYRLEEMKIKGDFLNKQSEIAIENAQRELDIFKQTHQSKIDSNTFFTEEMLKQEQQRLDDLFQKEKDFLDKKLELGLIKQYEYDDAINKIKEENRILQEEAQTQRDEAEAEKKVIDLENQRAIDEENFLTEYEIKTQRLEAERLQEIASAEKTGADVDKINTKYKLRQQQLDAQTKASQIQNTQNTFNEIGGLLKGFFGESKGLNVALATADMILGIQKAYVSQLIPGDPTSLPRAIGAGIQAGVFGAANVAKVAGVKFEQGGIMEIGGKRHSQGGTKFYGEDGTSFEAEQGELIGVMNRNASRLFMEFNDRYRDGGVVKRHNVFATGGFVQKAVLGKNTNANLNYDLLAQKVADANKLLPNPVVSVVDITDGQVNYTEVVNGANII